MSQRRGKRLAVLAFVGCAVLAPAAQSVMAQTSAVTIQNLSFQPGTVNVPVGTTVQWTNQDSVSHTVTSDSAAFGSSILSNGNSFGFTFSQAGTFPYHCNIHPFMVGQVVVGASPHATGTPGTPPAATATVSPTPAPTPTATPAARKLKVTVHGTLHVNHAGSLAVTVKDTGGHAVKGAQVAANLHPVGVSKVVKSKTNGKGTAGVTATPKRKGSIPIKVTKSGFAVRTVKVAVHS